MGSESQRMAESDYRTESARLAKRRRPVRRDRARGMWPHRREAHERPVTGVMVQPDEKLFYVPASTTSSQNRQRMVFG
jgi:hypothetical protein